MPLVKLVHNVCTIDVLHYFEGIVSHTWNYMKMQRQKNSTRSKTYEDVERLRTENGDNWIIPAGMIDNVTGRMLAALVLVTQISG